jgi:hypothetical protein
MSGLYEIAGWIWIGNGMLHLATVSIARKGFSRARALLPHPGAHVRPSRPTEPGERRKQWWELRYPLTSIGIGLMFLTKPDALVVSVVGVAVVVLITAPPSPVWDLGLWIRSRRRRNSGGATAEPS